MTGDKAGGIGGEKHRGARQFVELAEAPHGCAKQKLFPTFRSIEQSGVQIRAKYAGSQCVNTNARTGPLDGERFRQGSDARFASTIRSNLIQPTSEEIEPTLMMRP